MTKHSKLRPKRKPVLLLLAFVLTISLITILLKWPEYFQTTVAKELGMKKSHITNVSIGKANDKDTYSYRNFSLTGTIPNTERDRLLSLYSPYIKCDGECRAGRWFVPVVSSNTREDAARILKTNEPMCATRRVYEASVRIGEDQVCLATDSSIIWYTSTMSTLGL